jgi:hypothetical protein
MEAQRANRSGRRPRFAVAVLILGLIALVLGGLLYFNLLTVEQFAALFIVAFILVLGLFFTIRARGIGGKALALLGTLIVLAVSVVAGGILFSGLGPLQGEVSAPTETVNPGTGVTPTVDGSPVPTFAATATPQHPVGTAPGGVDLTLAEFGVSIISMVAGILSVIVSVFALFAARGANRPPSVS